MVVNPSSANGLAGMQLRRRSASATRRRRACPAGSQIGTVEVDTPLIDHPLPGAVYLAAQGDNPFGSLLAIYVVVDDPATGIVVKLAGHVEPDPATGQADDDASATTRSSRSKTSSSTSPAGHARR